MKLLFVSGTTVGGSGRSQRELAGRLEKQGHDVLFVVDHERPSPSRWLYLHLADAAAKYGERMGYRVVRWLEALPGRRTQRNVRDGVQHLDTPVPENATRSVIDSFDPDIVIGSSILRLAWRQVRAKCQERRIPTLLYIREEEALNHFSDGNPPADAIVANALSLQAAIAQRGFECSFIPSLIELDSTRTTSSRRAVLAINPIPSRGVDIVWALAARLPDLPFIAQESWPLTDSDLHEVQTNVARLPNVEFRRARPPGPELYGDARVLIVPYRVDNRPRVILEAQSNAIPVLVARVDALVEAIGSGGAAIEPDDIDSWCTELRAMWDDQDRYRTMCARALEHSTRPEVDPDEITGSFVALAESVVQRYR